MFHKINLVYYRNIINYLCKNNLKNHFTDFTDSYISSLWTKITH